MAFPITDSVSIDDVLKTALDLHMSQEQTLEFLRDSLDLATTTSKRVFAYAHPFATTSPGCGTSFTRSFVHSDWIDGESVVQAEQNTLEEGFNSRFHHIEDDLDGLARNIAAAFVCLATQRSELAALLDEIKAELNRINADIFKCCNKPQDPVYVYPGYPPNDYYAGGREPIGPVVYGGTPQVEDPMAPYVNPGNYGYGNYYYGGVMPGYRVLPGTSPVTPWGGEVTDPVKRYVDTITGKNTYSGPGTSITRSSTDATRAIVSGMSARLLEHTVLNGQAVELWATPAGVIMVPFSGQKPANAERLGWTNPRVDLTARFARWAANNDREVIAQLGETFELGAFAKSFGDQKVEGGISIADVVAGLSSDLQVHGASGLVPALAESGATAIVREGFASETVIGAVGTREANVSKAPASALKSVSATTAKAMTAAGIKTIGELANLTPADLSEKLNKAGVKVSVGEAGGIIGTAAGVAAVDRLARGEVGHGG